MEFELLFGAAGIGLACLWSVIQKVGGAIEQSICVASSRHDVISHGRGWNR